MECDVDIDNLFWRGLNSLLREIDYFSSAHRFFFLFCGALIINDQKKFKFKNKIFNGGAYTNTYSYFFFRKLALIKKKCFFALNLIVLKYTITFCFPTGILKYNFLLITLSVIYLFLSGCLIEHIMHQLDKRNWRELSSPP